MKEMTREKLDSYSNFMTVEDLLNFIAKHNIPETAKVMIERVTDMYYEGVDISGMRGPGGILPEGSKSNPWEVYVKQRYRYPNPSQYTPAWSCVRYEDDQDLLFIDLHY